MKARVLDAYRGPVETDRMPTTGADVDQLVDSTAGRDDEVRADVR